MIDRMQLVLKESYEIEKTWFIAFLILTFIILISGIIIFIFINESEGAIFLSLIFFPFGFAISHYSLMKTIKKGIKYDKVKNKPK